MNSKTLNLCLIAATGLVLTASAARADIILYATERDFGKLVTVNITTNVVTDFHITPDKPDSLILLPSGKFVYDLADPLVSQLRIFDPVANTDTLLAGPADGINSPQDLVLDPTNTFVLTANFLGNSITKTNLTTGVTTNVITGFPRPEGLAFDAAGNFFAFGGGFGGVAGIFQIAGGAIVNSNVGFDPTNTLDGLVYDPFTGKLFGTSQGGNALYRIDPVTLGATKLSVVLPQPDGLITDTHGILYIASRDFHVYKYDITANVLTQLTAVPGLDDLGAIALTPPVITKTFGASQIATGTSTTLTFTINNSNTGSPVTGLNFVDPLPAGLVVATPNGLTGNTCTPPGTITATAGASSVTLAGATVAASSSCTFTINVTGTIKGVKNNCVTVNSDNAGSSPESCAALTVVDLPSVNKQFGDKTITLNGSTTLTFTVTNPNASVLTNFGFTDNLPAGLVVSNPNGLTANTCTPAGTIAATAGSGTISATGITVAASSTCSFTVNVTGTSVGEKDNCLAPNNCASISVLAPPVILKKFAVNQINLSATTTLTFTITNPNGTTVPPSTLLGVAFTDTLPAGLTATSPAITNTCTPPGSVTVTPPSTIALTGATLAAGATCTISVTVTGSTVGTKLNSVTVTSTNGGPGNTSTATLVVGVTPPDIKKEFGSGSVPSGATVTLKFTLTNLNPVTVLTGLTFTDALPAGMIVATPNGLTGNTCTPPGTITALAGSSSVGLAGATLAPGASCTFTVNVTVNGEGTLVNSTGLVTSNEADPGGPGTATLAVGGASIQINYFPNLNLADSVINITNTGALGGSQQFGTSAAIPGAICANVYSFSPDEQLVSCCSCPVTPNGLVSLSVVNDLISNTLTPARPTSIVVKLVGTVPVGGTCVGSAATALTATLTPGLLAWGTKNHPINGPAGGTLLLTETPFLDGTLSPGERARIGTACNFIVGNGSGFGICNSCRVGGLGGTVR